MPSMRLPPPGWGDPPYTAGDTVFYKGGFHRVERIEWKEWKWRLPDWYVHLEGVAQGMHPKELTGVCRAPVLERHDRYDEASGRAIEKVLVLTDLADMIAFNKLGRLNEVLRRAFRFIEGEDR